MAASCGTCSLTPLVAIVGLSALGYAGFSYFNGSCSSCTDPAQATTATLVAAPEAAEPSCCPMGGEKVQNVVLASGASGECSGKTACEGEKTACEGEQIACTEGAKSECSGKSCDGEIAAATVITAASTATKSACCKGDPNCAGDCTGDCCGACDEKKPAQPAPAGGN